MWRWTGRERPPFAHQITEGQESVWDYPRPPALVPDLREVVVRVGGVEVVRTSRALRLLETASPPTFYLPFADALRDAFVPARGSSGCEWKGVARYWSIVAGGVRLERAAWSYDDPAAPYTAIRDHVALYATEAECTVGGERVRPQDGGFYGGWVTSEIVGPWKGAGATSSW
jgi:uncharacterized protein (DUF427 family)